MIESERPGKRAHNHVKFCKTCGAEKAFYPDRRDDPGGPGNYKCRPCLKEKCKAYAKNNPEMMRKHVIKNRAKAAARTRAWYQENKHYARDYAQRYREEHPEWHKSSLREYRKRFPEKCAANEARWAKNNPEKMAEKRRRRYARKRGATVDLTSEEYVAIQDAATHCFYCGAPRSGRHRLALDHIHPLSRGGHHTRQNLVPACQRCNSSKGYSFLDEWTQRTGMVIFPMPSGVVISDPD
jgi:5-methylcytosine-specific restriction endonuclease McrA